MKFNDHSKLNGAHAFLSASNYHWVNYTDERMIARLETKQAAARGTRLHDFAKQAIDLRQRLPRAEKTLNMYVNDAIGFGMNTEVVLFYSINAFGTADAISFQKKSRSDPRDIQGTLRIHDLKTGTSRVSMLQLEIYAALFCLEYGFHPHELHIVLRIYKEDVIDEKIPEGVELENIARIMLRIKHFDKLIEERKAAMQ